MGVGGFVLREHDFVVGQRKTGGNVQVTVKGGLDSQHQFLVQLSRG